MSPIHRLRAAALVAVAALTAPLHAQSLPATPTLEIRASGPTEGHVQLVWSPADGSEGLELRFELQESPDGEFAAPLLRYSGDQRACFVSGLGDGAFSYRVRQASDADGGAFGPWSETVTVEIAHYPLRLAWGLFGLGAFLVAGIVGFLFVADRRVRAEEGR